MIDPLEVAPISLPCDDLSGGEVELELPVREPRLRGIFDGESPSRLADFSWGVGVFAVTNLFPDGTFFGGTKRFRFIFSVDLTGFCAPKPLGAAFGGVTCFFPK